MKRIGLCIGALLCLGVASSLALAGDVCDPAQDPFCLAACCLDDQCAYIIAADCIEKGGIVGEAGSDCETTTCGGEICDPAEDPFCPVACCLEGECAYIGAEDCADLGGIVGEAGSDCETTVCEEPPIECRVTGGGHDESGYWDGEMASGKCPMGNGMDQYTYGGQAGAPTAAQPQPYGEWTHHQKSGPDGSFVFHGGTASAPPATEIDYVVCSDPGWCVQARPAPAKQIDFDGVGSFKNTKNVPPIIENAVIVGVTLHYFHVHIEDLGEPGKGKKNDVGNCPEDGNAGMVADCNCSDFYEITIHEGITSASPVIYHVHGYVDGGNFQIHPPIF